MGTRTSKTPRKKRNKAPNPQELSTDYHCYSCNLSSEQHIENNNIFKELLYVQSPLNKPNHLLHPIKPSHFNSILSNSIASLMHYSMICASGITQLNSREVSLLYITSYRFEENIGQLEHYNDIMVPMRKEVLNEKVYCGYTEIEKEANEANMLRNYLMNDTISTRNENSIKGRVNIITLDKKMIKETIGNNRTIKSMSPTDKKKNIKEGSYNDEKEFIKGSYNNNVIMNKGVNNKINNGSAVIYASNTNSTDIANKEKNYFKPKVKVLVINAQTKDREPNVKKNNSNRNKSKETSPLQISQETNKNTRNDTIKVSTLLLNNKKRNTPINAIISPLHIPHPIPRHKRLQLNQANISKSPDPLHNKPTHSSRPNKNNNNLNIYIQEINVFNNNNRKQSPPIPIPNPIQSRPKSNDSNNPSNNKEKQIMNCFKVNLTKILDKTNKGNVNKTSNDEYNSNPINTQEKYSITSQESNSTDIRRIDTPKFNHEHKRSLSSNHLMDFHPNNYHYSSNDPPLLSGEKFSFKRNHE